MPGGGSRGEEGEGAGPAAPGAGDAVAAGGGGGVEDPSAPVPAVRIAALPGPGPGPAPGAGAAAPPPGADAAPPALPCLPSALVPAALPEVRNRSWDPSQASLLPIRLRIDCSTREPLTRFSMAVSWCSSSTKSVPGALCTSGAVR